MKFMVNGEWYVGTGAEQEPNAISIAIPVFH